ncbi:MAG: hypothetical protein AAFO08_03545, partial [Pseudomonadota bacterium]
MPGSDGLPVSATSLFSIIDSISFNRLLKSPKEKNVKLFCPFCCYGFRKDCNGEKNLAEHKIHCGVH